MKYKLFVSRFEYDNIRYVVAFNCVFNNITKKYEVSFKSDKKLSENEACLIAYNQLKHKIDFDINNITDTNKTVIGKEFIPYEDDPPEYYI
jgi:hypothetical protein